MSAKRLHVYHGKRKTGRWLAALIPLAVLAGVALLWGYDASSGFRPRTVEICLLDDSGAPLKNEPVGRLIDTAALPIGQWGGQGGSTGPDGRCRFEGVAPGSYWLRAAENLYEITIAENAPASLSLSLPAAPDRYTLILRLREEGGGPIPRQAVALLERELEKGAATSFSQVKAGESDWQGDLVLEEVQAGGHLLCIEGYAPLPLLIEPNGKKTVNATLTAYPEQEAPVSQSLAFYDGSRPLPDEPVTLVLYGLPGGREAALAAFRTDETGALAFSPPFPGEYTLRVRGRRFRLQAGTGQAQRLYLYGEARQTGAGKKAQNSLRGKLSLAARAVLRAEAP